MFVYAYLHKLFILECPVIANKSSPISEVPSVLTSIDNSKGKYNIIFYNLGL